MLQSTKIRGVIVTEVNTLAKEKMIGLYNSSFRVYQYCPKDSVTVVNSSAK